MKSRWIQTVAAVTAIVASQTGCGAPAPAALSAADQQAIRHADSAGVAAIAAKDWPAWTGAFTEQGELLPPNGDALQGRAAIQAWSEAFPPFSDFQASITQLDGRGDLAYLRGTYSMTIAPVGAPAPIMDHGKYVSVWRKQADGSWKMTHDIFNSDVPLAAPPAATP